MPSEISIPFRLTASGGIASESNPDRQIRNHVMSLINTNPGERVVLTDYGVPLLDALFEDGDETVATIISDQIQNAFAIWEPGIVLESVAPDPNGKYGDGLTVVDVEYARADSPESANTTRKTNTAIIRVGGDVREVIRG